MRDGRQRHVRQACLDQDNSDTANDGFYTFDVLVNQGIFLADTQLNKLFLVAQTGSLYDDFLFWNFSGNAGQGGGDDSEDLEGARWRSSAFLAIDGNDVVFKAALGYVDGPCRGRQAARRACSARWMCPTPPPTSTCSRS